MGSGAYMNISVNKIYEQALFSSYYADGIAYFEYYSYLSHGCSKFLSDNIYLKNAIPPTYKSLGAINLQIDFSIKRIREVIITHNDLNHDHGLRIINNFETLKNSLSISNISNFINEIDLLETTNNTKKVIKRDLEKALKILKLSKDN